MRTASTQLKTGFALGKSLCRLMRITRRDGTIVRMADINSDLPVYGETFEKTPGFNITSISLKDDGTPATMEFDVPVDSDGPLKPIDVIAGVYDGADVQILKVDFKNPDSGTMIEFTGYVGDIDYNNGGAATIEIRSLLSRFSELIVDKFDPNCPWNLGDRHTCRVPIKPDLVQRSTSYDVASDSDPRGDHVRVFQAGSYGNRMFECTTAGITDTVQPTYDFTVDNTTADGTAIFTCREAWLRFATVATVVNSLKFTLTITEPRAITGWFDNGALQFSTGNNAGIPYDIRRWTESINLLELWTPARGTIQVGDELYLYPGCNKVKASEGGCGKFSNEFFFGGFDKAPTESFAFSRGNEVSSSSGGTGQSGGSDNFIWPGL